MEKKANTRRPISKAKFSKICISAILAAVALFTAAMIILYALYGGVPDTLIISVFGFAGGEAGILGFIKVNDKKKESDIPDDKAVG